MTEKDFRKLVTDLEVLSDEKIKINEKIDFLTSILTFNKDEFYEVLEVKKVGSFASGTFLTDTDEIDLAVVVKPNIDRSFVVDNYYILNSIENLIISKYFDIIKLSHITRNNSKNMITFTSSSFTINLYVCYLEGLYDINLFNKRIEFVEIANRDYTYYRNALKIIKYYRDINKINISGYILEIMLYYSLNEYFRDNRYETYLNGFIKTIDEFTKGNKIQVSKDIYQKLNIDPDNNVKRPYMVLDLTNPKINLTDNVNDVNITEYRKLKKALSKLITTNQNLEFSSSTVVLNINPVLNAEKNEYTWNFDINQGLIKNSGGSYGLTEDELLTALYKGLYKGMRAIVDNNLNKKNIEVISNKGNILKLSSVNEENKSRIKNIETYIKNNDLVVSFK